MTHYADTGRFRHILSVGIAIALAVFIKQTALVVLFASVVFWILIFRKRRSEWLSVVGALTLPTLGVFLAFYGYYASLGTGASFIRWVIAVPLFELTHYDAYYHLPPTFFDWHLIAPAYGWVVLLVGLLVTQQSPARNRRRAWLACAWTIALFLPAIPRWGFFHLLPSVLFAAVCFGYSIMWLRKLPTTSWKIFFIVASVVLSLQSYRMLKYLYVVRNPSLQGFIDSKTERIILQARSTIGTKELYVFGNYDMIYFFLNRMPSVLPWYQLLPGIARVPGVQESIIASLEVNRPPVVIYAPFNPQTKYTKDYVPEQLWTYIFSRYQMEPTQPLAPDVYFLTPNK